MILLASLLGATHFFVDASSGDALRPRIERVYGTAIYYDHRLFQEDPIECDLFLNGDPFNHTWIGGCPSNYCNPGIEDCQQRWVGNKVRCRCNEFGLSKCYAEATVNADNQVTGVECTQNGCVQDCDLVLWMPGNFYPCWCP